MRMCAHAIWNNHVIIAVKTEDYEPSRKHDARLTLQIAALRHSFFVLRRFAMPHAPYSGVSSLFDLHRRAPKPGGFFLGASVLG